MSTSRNYHLERITNLTFAFLNAAQNSSGELTLDYIRNHITGYAKDNNGKPRSPEAVYKLIRRDLNSLEHAGVPLEMYKVGEDTVWRLQAEEYELPEVSFTPEEATVLGLAGKMGQGDQLATFSRSGWTKIAASGVDSQLTPTPIFTPINDWNTLGAEDFDLITKACATQQRIGFYYQRTLVSDYEERWMDPWGIVTNRDRLYLVGFDLDRQAPRCFRITRVSDLELLDPDEYELEPYGEFQTPPPGYNLQELVISQLRQGMTLVDATVRIEAGKADVLRSRAHHVAGDEYQLIDVDADWLVRQAAALAPAVVVTSPPEIVDKIIKLLKEAVDHGAA